MTNRSWINFKNSLKYLNKLSYSFVIKISAQELIVLLSLIWLITNLSASAVVINYNAAGGVTSVSGGYGRPYGSMYSTRTINNYGSNAAFAPNTVQKTQARMIRDSYEKQYLESLKNTQNINVNVNHTGYPINRYYTNSGFNRYYPNIYRNNYVPTYAGSGIYYNTGNGINIPGIRMF